MLLLASCQAEPREGMKTRTHAECGWICCLLSESVNLSMLLLSTLEGPPMAWHFEGPDMWLSLSPADRAKRGELSSDQCVIDGVHFFVRGLIEIPVIQSDEIFAWVSGFLSARRAFSEPLNSGRMRGESASLPTLDGSATRCPFTLTPGT